MDCYKIKIIKNILLFVLFVIGTVLQFYGHSVENTNGLIIQFVSLSFLLIVLYLYNRRYR